MTKHKRIEITAFRRRILVVSDGPAAPSAVDVRVNVADTIEPVATGSGEEKEILIEAIRLLEERVAEPARQTIEPPLVGPPSDRY